MIYLFTQHNLISEDILDSLILKLPENRRQKALSFKNVSSKLSSVLAYLVFLYGFRNICNCKELPEFATMESGKPYIKDYPDIHFNISHCEGGVCCFFGKNPVGIDIQDKRRLNSSIIRKVCNENEIEQIETSPVPELEFARIWSVKESFSKINGDGIFRDLQNLDYKNVNFFTKLVDDNKYMTASSYDKAACFDIINLSVSDLISL